MQQPQARAGIVMLAIGGIGAALAGILSASLGEWRPAALFGAAGACLALVLVSCFWRIALDRAGYYGRGADRPARFGITPRAEGVISGMVCASLAVLFIGTMLMTGVGVRFFSCISAFLAGLTLIAGAAEFGALWLTEAKWRYRERG